MLTTRSYSSADSSVPLDEMPLRPVYLHLLPNPILEICGERRERFQHGLESNVRADLISGDVMPAAKFRVPPNRTSRRIFRYRILSPEEPAAAVSQIFAFVQVHQSIPLVGLAFSAAYFEAAAPVLLAVQIYWLAENVALVVEGIPGDASVSTAVGYQHRPGIDPLQLPAVDGASKPDISVALAVGPGLSGILP